MRQFYFCCLEVKNFHNLVVSQLHVDSEGRTFFAFYRIGKSLNTGCRNAALKQRQKIVASPLLRLIVECRIHTVKWKNLDDQKFSIIILPPLLSNLGYKETFAL